MTTIHFALSTTHAKFNHDHNHNRNDSENVDDLQLDKQRTYSQETNFTARRYYTVRYAAILRYFRLSVFSETQFNSLEFALHGYFMKIFDTGCKDIVLYCMKMFNVQSPCHDIIKRKCKFLYNIMSSANFLRQICKDFAERNCVVILIQTTCIIIVFLQLSF